MIGVVDAIGSAGANRGFEVPQINRAGINIDISRPGMKQIHAVVAAAPRAPEEHMLLIIVGIHEHRQHDLAFVGHALGAIGLLLDLAQRGQQHRNHDGDDSDDNQQFNQRKSATSHDLPPFRPEC